MSLKMNSIKCCLFITTYLFLGGRVFSQAREMTTEWGEEVIANNVWQEYPRPQFVREEWKSLNGLWDYAILKASEPKPRSFQGEILVPFSVESALSGVQKSVQPEDRIWYKRSFTVPNEWSEKAIILNFDAVDYSCSVWLNGAWVGSHKGGFDRFSFDITRYLKAGGKQELIVCVDDPSSYGMQPRGKQQIPPHKIWYTPVSGIWQSVWMEAVSKEAWLQEVKIVPDIDKGEISFTSFANKPLLPEYAVQISILDNGRVLAKRTSSPNLQEKIAIPSPKLWSPDSPYLYDVQLTLLSPSGEVLDEVTSYFGMRKISVGDHEGHQYLFLNNEPLFHYGTLDQGWWPDGLHTPPSDQAMRFDIKVTKEMGFNMIRKHIKVEPDRWYYHCDKLGMLVWQDMPSAMAVLPKEEIGAKPHHLQHVWRSSEEQLNRPSTETIPFETELSKMIHSHYNSPSIVMWVPFNEGMGQYETCRISDMVKALDPSRLVNPISGWKLYPCGDLYDIHTYGVDMDQPVHPIDRATAIGEFGGVGFPVKGHLWNPEMDNWGYQTYYSEEDLIKNYKYKFDQIVKMESRLGLSAAVYTQITDVEGEVNGLITYDRRVIKIPKNVLFQMHRKLFEEENSSAGD